MVRTIPNYFTKKRLLWNGFCGSPFYRGSEKEDSEPFWGDSWAYPLMSALLNGIIYSKSHNT